MLQRLAVAEPELWALEGEEPLLALAPVKALPQEILELEQHWLQLALPILVVLMSGVGPAWVFEVLELVEELDLHL